MHIPDGFLDPKISMGLIGAASLVVGFSAAKVKEALTSLSPRQALALAGRAAGNLTLGGRRVLTGLGEQKLYQMGMVAALVFAGQMFNFPVGQGTSGHLLGGVFATVLLGPFAGTLVISAVLLVQFLFFADGGLLALGANIINMAFLGSFVSYYIYSGLKKFLPQWARMAIAAWLSVILASLACALEIGLSGTISFSAIIPAILKTHAVIGIAEALLTLALVNLFRKIIIE